MSQFASLDPVKDTICQDTHPCSWMPYIQNLQNLQAKMPTESPAIARRLKHVQAAMALTGEVPTLAELISAIRSQTFGSSLHRTLLQHAAAHIAKGLLEFAWPHSVILNIILAARAYQLFLCGPVVGSDDESNGIKYEVTAFVEGWLATL